MVLSGPLAIEPGRRWHRGAIIAEVLHRVAVADEAGREIVREAPEGATAGRRPR